MTPSPERSDALPGWARAIDIAALVLLALAITTAAFGGFRVRLGGTRFAVTSSPRLLLWAAVLLVLRHLLAPQRPLYRQVVKWVWTRAQSPAWRTALLATVTTRFVIMLVGYLAVSTIGYPPGAPPYRLFEHEFANLPVRWDTGWYLGIATQGYQWSGIATEQQTIVFFPAYPMLIRFVGRLLLGNRLQLYVLGAVAISVSAFAAALVYLYRHARERLDQDHAIGALWLMASYPFAIFFGAAYSESLFLLAAVAAFVHLERGQHLRAGVWGLLAGLTRPNGCFLALPLALAVLEPWLPRALRYQAGDRPRDRRALVRGLIAAAMPAMGVLLYSAYIGMLTGNPLAWAEGHAAWGRTYHGLIPLVTDRYQYIQSSGLAGYVETLPYDLLNALGVVFVLATVWPVTRRLGAAYAVFILINILPPLAAGGLLSAGRLSAVLFPAFVWFAGALPPRHRPAWITTFMALQAFNAALFYTWRPMY